MKVKVLYSIIFIFLAFTQQLLPAQNLSAGCRFEVDYKAGCAPFTVNVTEVKLIGILKDYDFDGDGNFEGGVPASFTYNTPGTYYLIQLAASQPVRLDSIEITVLEPIPPIFTVGNCSGNSVQMNISDTYYDQFSIDFGDTNSILINQGDPIAPYIYAAQGSYNITVRGIITGAKDNCGVDIRSVNTVAALPAGDFDSAEVVTVDPANGSVLLNYNLNPNVVYNLEMAVNNNTAFSFAATLTDPNTILINNLNTSDNFYCYRIVATDPCNGTTVSSESICTINVDGEAQNNLNQLTWTTQNPTSSGYTVQRDGIQLITLAATQNDYADNDVECTIEYCYRIIDNYGNGSFSVSGEICLTAISNDTPVAIEEITSSIVNREVTLAWDLPANFIPNEYTISRTVNGGISQTLQTTTNNGFSDNLVSFPENTYCYTLVYTDICGNTSPISVETCPVILTGETPSQQEVRLIWTPYEGWVNGVNDYVVEILDDQGNIITTISVGNNLSFFDTPFDHGVQILWYRIRAISNHATPLESISNIYRVQLEPLLFIPNAFSPNNNRMNDLFEVKGKFFQTFRLLIYNRWGELIFQTTNPDQGWDGTFNGKPVPSATYIYRVDVTDFLGLKTVKQGGVLLIR